MNAFTLRTNSPHTNDESETRASYKCGYSGLFVDLFISALFHGCISGHSEEVVAQSEEKQWEMPQMYEAQTCVFSDSQELKSPVQKFGYFWICLS